MKITNLEELLQALGAKKVFKADGTLTKQAEKAYDKLVNIGFWRNTRFCRKEVDRFTRRLDGRRNQK